MLARRLPTTGRSRPAPGLAASPPTRTHDRPSWSTGDLRHQIQPPACTSVPQIAAMWMTDESHVRKMIHEFNERGMPRWTVNSRPSFGWAVPGSNRGPPACKSAPLKPTTGDDRHDRLQTAHVWGNIRDLAAPRREPLRERLGHYRAIG